MIDETSHIDADGMSRATKGSDRDNGQGASYVGQGGYCGHAFEDKTYGAFDLLPNKSNMYDSKSARLSGSVGMVAPFAEATGGGGRLHIDVDSIKLIGEGA